jgi:hypothetical protein
VADGREEQPVARFAHEPLADDVDDVVFACLPKDEIA